AEIRAERELLELGAEPVDRLGARERAVRIGEVDVARLRRSLPGLAYERSEPVVVRALVGAGFVQRPGRAGRDRSDVEVVGEELRCDEQAREREVGVRGSDGERRRRPE